MNRYHLVELSLDPESGTWRNGSSTPRCGPAGGWIFHISNSVRLAGDHLDPYLLDIGIELQNDPSEDEKKLIDELFHPTSGHGRLSRRLWGGVRPSNVLVQLSDVVLNKRADIARFVTSIEETRNNAVANERYAQWLVRSTRRLGDLALAAKNEGLPRLHSSLEEHVQLALRSAWNMPGGEEQIRANLKSFVELSDAPFLSRFGTIDDNELPEPPTDLWGEPPEPASSTSFQADAPAARATSPRSQSMIVDGWTIATVGTRHTLSSPPDCQQGIWKVRFADVADVLVVVDDVGLKPVVLHDLAVTPGADISVEHLESDVTDPGVKAVLAGRRALGQHYVGQDPREQWEQCARHWEVTGDALRASTAWALAHRPRLASLLVAGLNARTDDA